MEPFPISDVCPRLPSHLKRQRIEHDLAPEDKHCAACNQDLRHIGEELSERYEYIPAQMLVIEDACQKYACACTVKTAAKPAQPIAKSTAGASLLAHVITSKVADHLPSIEKWDVGSDLNTEATRENLKQIAKATYATCEEQFGRISFNVVRRVIAVLYGSQLWSVEMNGDPIANKVIDRVVAGDTNNTSRLFVNRFASYCHQNKTMADVVGLAAHSVLAAGEENPYSIRGVEVVVVPLGGKPRTSSHEQDGSFNKRTEAEALMSPTATGPDIKLATVGPLRDPAELSA